MMMAEPSDARVATGWSARLTFLGGLVPSSRSSRVHIDVKHVGASKR